MSDKHVIPIRRDGRTLCLYWKRKKKVHLWNMCVRYSRLALGSLGLMVSSSLQISSFTNCSSSRISLTSQNRTFEMAPLGIVTEVSFSALLTFCCVQNLLPYRHTSRQTILFWDFYQDKTSLRITAARTGSSYLWHVSHGPCVSFWPDVWIWARSITWHSLHIALWLLDGAWLRVYLPFTGKGQTD